MNQSSLQILGRKRGRIGDSRQDTTGVLSFDSRFNRLVGNRGTISFRPGAAAKQDQVEPVVYLINAVFLRLRAAIARVRLRFKGAEYALIMGAS